MDATLETIIQAGAVGISLTLIALLYYLLKMVFDFIKSHIRHNTEVTGRNTEVMIEMIGYIKENAGVVKESAEIMREVKNLLKKYNGVK